MILDSDSGSQGDPLAGGQGVGLQGPMGSRGRPTPYRVPGGHGVGLQGPRGSRGRPTGSQGVKG